MKISHSPRHNDCVRKLVSRWFTWDKPQPGHDAHRLASVTVEGFHNPPAGRLRTGEDSLEARAQEFGVEVSSLVLVRLEWQRLHLD